MKSKTRVGILTLVMTMAVTFCAACTATMTRASTVAANEYYQEETVYYELFETGKNSELKKMSKEAYEDNSNVEKKYREDKKKSKDESDEVSIESDLFIAQGVILPPEEEEFPPRILLSGVTNGGTAVNTSVVATVQCEVVSTKRYRINSGNWITFTTSSRTFSSLGYYQVNAFNIYGSVTVAFTIADNYYVQQELTGTAAMAYARQVTSVRYYPLTRIVVYQVKSIWDVLPTFRKDSDVLLFSVDARQSDLLKDPTASIVLSTSYRRSDAEVQYDEYGTPIGILYTEYDVNTSNTYGFNGTTPNPINDVIKVTEESTGLGKTSVCVKAYIIHPYDQPYVQFLYGTNTLTITTKVSTGWTADLGAVSTMAHSTHIYGEYIQIIQYQNLFYINQSICEFVKLKSSLATVALTPNLASLINLYGYSALLLVYNDRPNADFAIQYLHSSVYLNLPNN